MKYTDSELWEISDKELNEIKTTYSFQEFCLWSIERLSELINLSTFRDDWMDPDISLLRDYRIKARDNFYYEKLVKDI